MKAYPATKRDNERNIMRLELTGNDVEILDLLVDRLDKFLVIEKELGVVAAHSPSIFGTDLPTVTQEGRDLVKEIVEAWDDAG